MRSSNKQLTLLSEAEQAALYELPDFDEEQRVKYLRFSKEELDLIQSRKALPWKVLIKQAPFCKISSRTDYT